MTPNKPRRSLHPLRKVISIAVSDEMGMDLGSPRYSWLARRYTLDLECGHKQVRIGSNVNNLPPSEFMPKSVRCKDCRPMSVPSKARTHPKHDYLGNALSTAIQSVGTDMEREAAHAWVESHGGWVEDKADRAFVYASVAVFLLDMYLLGEQVRHAPDLRAAIVGWAHKPSKATKDRVRKIARRTYNAQHTAGNDWYTTRAVICLGRVASLGPVSANGIIESLTWDEASRGEFYSRLMEAQDRLDHERATGFLLAGAPGDPWAREGELERSSQAAQAAREDFERIWSEEYPRIAEHHLPLLLHLLYVYEQARDGEWVIPPREK